MVTLLKLSITNPRKKTQNYCDIHALLTKNAILRKSCFWKYSSVIVCIFCIGCWDMISYNVMQRIKSVDDVWQTEPPAPNNYAECKCSIRGDPIVTKFDGARGVVQGAKTVILYSNARHGIWVSATMRYGDGLLNTTTVIDKVILRKGAGGNQLVFVGGKLLVSLY